MKKMVMFSIVTLFLTLIAAHAADIVPPVIEQPGTQPEEVANLESPNKCDNCHGGYNRATEPAHNWRGSMMANAGRDPIFWATVAIAEQDFNGSGDLCIRCHSTGGWLRGRSTPTDGSGLAAGDSDGVDCDFCHLMTKPDNSEHLGVMNEPYVAHEVSETTANGLEPYYGSGMASIWPDSDKLGPYFNAEARHKFMKSNFHRSPDFCGTCHDVSNPAVGNLAHNSGRQPTAEPVIKDSSLAGSVDSKAAFNNPPYKYGVVERTFSEYKSALISKTLVNDFKTLPTDLQGGALAAIYEAATQGGLISGNYEDGEPRYYTCQSCHMRPITGQGCNKNPPIRSDLALHDMTGGNYWMPEAIIWLDNQDKLVLGGGLSNDQLDALTASKLRAKEQLELAATLSVQGNSVKIVNHTGHKLISGYPEGRRMWLNIKWFDDEGNLLREDGKYGDIATHLGTVRSLLDPDDTNSKVYEAHYGVTREWAAQLLSLGYAPDHAVSYDRLTGEVTATLASIEAGASESVHESFHFVLNNTVIKDNRIPPYGMQYDEARRRNALPVPASQYGSPDPGQTYNYWDEVPLLPPAEATSGTISLMYQPTSWEYIQFLYLANKGVDPANGGNVFLGDEGYNMLRAWLNTGMAEPHVMATTSWGTPQDSCNAPIATLNETIPGNGSVTVSWSDQHTTNNSVLGYNLYYDQAGKAQHVSDTWLETTFTDTNLTNGQRYCYKVTTYTADCESAFSNILCAIPNSQSQARAGVATLNTGSLITSGKGKKSTTIFELDESFTAGEDIVFRVTVLDRATGQPLQNGLVDLLISGPETFTITAGPSDGHGIAETSWQTTPAKKRTGGGTPSGNYSVAVSDLTASGYTWDEVRTGNAFVIR